MKAIYKFKYGIKYFIANVLYYSGLLFVIKSVRLNDRVVVLMYHRVLDQQEQEKTFSHPGIVVDKDVFAKQMACLEKKFNVISEEEFFRCIKEKRSFDKNSCFITFDDGWIDNYTNAYPVLLRLKLPATIFLTTSFIGTGELFWQEKLSARLFDLYRKADIKSQDVLNRNGFDGLHNLSVAEAKAKIRSYITQIKRLRSSDIRELLTVFSGSDPSYSNASSVDSFMDWEQVSEMSRNGISFGSHSVHHNILTKIPTEEAEEEITLSREFLAEQIGCSPRTFCYPNGDYSNDIANRVEESGYQGAFSTISGFVDIHDNIYAIKRMNIHTDATNNIPLFMSRILGLF